MKQLTALAMTTFLLFGPMSMEYTLANQNMPSKQRMKNSFDQFKSNLNLTDKQEVYWQNYMNAMQEMRALHKEMRQAKKQNKDMSQNPVERLDQKISFIEKQTEALKKVRIALNALYTNLSAEQKTLFEQNKRKMRKHVENRKKHDTHHSHDFE